MKCDELKLFLYADGEGTDAERESIKAHLSECKRCQKKYERLKFTMDSFTSYYMEKERISCPSGADLVNFQEDQLDEKTRAGVSAHIDGCKKCQEELKLLEECDKEVFEAGGIFPEALISREVMDQVGNIGRRSMRDRMEHVLKTLMEKGKEVLTPDKIKEILDRHFSQSMEPVPVHALPESAAYFDPELTLHESAVCDISVSIGGYLLTIRAVDDMLTVMVTRDGTGVGNVEVTIMTKNLGARKATTGSDGVGVIAGIQQGPYQISIRVRDDHE